MSSLLILVTRTSHKLLKQSYSGTIVQACVISVGWRLKGPIKIAFFSLIPIPSPKEKGIYGFLEVPLSKQAAEILTMQNGSVEILNN